jgi:hypothetical protein
MNIYLRIIISVAILIIHFVGFFLPLTEVFVIYILLVNPAWFRNFLNNLDKPKEASKSETA